MSGAAGRSVEDVIATIYREESRIVFATLIRRLHDFDLAEEALHEAFSSAVEKWPAEGVPENPRAWLISAGRFKAIDLIRSESRRRHLGPAVARVLEEVADNNASKAAHEIEDDRLRLIFTCCHPAIDPLVRVPLTLREVCGLTTEEIAGAFLTRPATMAQRIVRGKVKIRDAGIPFAMPALEELPERLEPVLSVIYLVFNEGYSASGGNSVVRADLSGEAIRLARLVHELLPEPEVMGLLALMLLHESRRPARMGPDGDLILLDQQDRALWDSALIAEGQGLVERALATRRIGPYAIQAAISAVHAKAGRAEETDWEQIVALYDLLWRMNRSPVVALNRGVAIAMRDGPLLGLRAIEEVLEQGELSDYHLAHSARGEMLRRLGRFSEAEKAFERALDLAQQEPERRFLRGKLEEMRGEKHKG